MTLPRHSPARPGRRASKNTSFGAGLVGTGIIALAQAVGVHTATGQVLLYTAPAVSVIVGAMFVQLHHEAGATASGRQIRRVRRTFERQLRNTHTVG